MQKKIDNKVSADVDSGRKRERGNWQKASRSRKHPARLGIDSRTLITGEAEGV